MFQQIAITLAYKAMLRLLCTMFGLCLDHEDCPDGVCDEALAMIDDELAGPEPSPKAMASNAEPLTQSFGDINFAHLKDVADAVMQLIAALRLLFGKDEVTGG